MDKLNLFTAHNHLDREIAERIASSLEYEDLQPRIGSWESVPGDSFVEWMDNSLGVSRFLILIWPHNAAESPRVEKEWRPFLPEVVSEKAAKIIPSLLDETPLPPLLSDIIPIRYDKNMMNVMSELLKAIYGPASRKSQSREARGGSAECNGV